LIKITSKYKNEMKLKPNNTRLLFRLVAADLVLNGEPSIFLLPNFSLPKNIGGSKELVVLL